ncbi:MAG: carboxypeptidase-like regulatory domain-containing protein, partial [Chitinophagaceae bacterium]
MKRHPLYLTTLLLAILAFAGNCRKSEFSLESQSQTVSFTISGRVLDKNNVPVSQAEVKAGGAVTTTDANGNFTLDNVRSKKNAAYVQVLKAGYFPGSRTFVAHAQAINYVSIRLIDKEVTGSFAATGGGSVNLSSGGSVNFQPNSIADAASGAVYTGTVFVSAFFIDPSLQDFTSIMPGDLRGTNASGQERGLESFGMMAVELNGPGGQKLQLASSKKATIKFPIPAALLSDAPATIPLWYFDEATGMWKEEGSATKQGSEYIGEVGHFSFWNCDAPFQLVNFEAIVKDQNGNAVANAEVRIKKVSDGSIGCGRTDGAGKVSGKIPANEALTIKVIDRCNATLYTQNIGPFAANVNLETINVNVSPNTILTVTGTAVNCSNAAVTNGFVHVALDGMSFRSAINN